MDLRRLLSSLALLSAVLPAAAATRTWDGGGGNANWSNAVNWAGDAAPAAGDALVFPAGALQAISVNDFPAGTTFEAVTVSAAYQLSGNGITLSGGFTASALSSPVLLQMPVKLAGAQTFSHNGTGLVTLGDVDTNGHTLTFSITGTGAIMPGIISGTGGLMKSGTGPLTLSAANTYNGVTTINAGVVTVSGTGALGASGAGAGNTVVAAAGTLELSSAAGFSLTEDFSLAGVIRQAPAATVTHTLTGGIALAGGTAVLDAAGTGTLVAEGVITGTGPLRLRSHPTAVANSQGEIRITGAASNTYTGTTLVEEAYVVLAKSAGALAVPGNLDIGAPGDAVRSYVTMEADHQINPAATVRCFAATGPSESIFSPDNFTQALGHLELTHGIAFSRTLYLGTIILNGDLTVLDGGLPDTPGKILVSLVVPGVSTWTVADAAGATDLLVYDLIVQPGGRVVKQGSGSMAVRRSSGALEVAQGHARIMESPSTAILLNGGSLSTFGFPKQTGDVTSLSGGGVIIGEAGPGLRLGSLNLNAATEIRPRLDDSGDPAVEITGTVALGNTLLTPTWAGPGSPVIGSIIVLLENDGSDPVSGIFAGKPQGTIFSPAGAPSSVLQISYTGGDGNDVTLTVVPEPPVVWDGGGGNGLFSVAANWNPNVVPPNGSRLVFGNASVRNLTNNLTLAQFESLEFAQPDYTLAGNAFSLNDGIKVTSPGGETVISGGTITLREHQTFEVTEAAAELTLSGTGILDLDDHTLQTTGPGTVRITRPVTGVQSVSNIICREGSTLFLESAVMTHDGVTQAEGTLVVNGFLFSSHAALNGGTLGGGGTLNDGLTTSFLAPGIIDPGIAGPADLSVNGDVLLTEVTTLRIRLHGAGTATADKLNVNGGSFALDRTALEFIADDGFYPANGQVFHIVTNNGSGPVIGTFAGKPQNSIINIGPHQFRLSYTGGSGNDITLTALTRTSVWDAGGNNDNWSNADNWVGNEDVTEGDNVIVAGLAAADFHTDHDYLFARSYRSLTILNSASEVRSGSRFILSAGLEMDNSKLLAPVHLSASQTWRLNRAFISYHLLGIGENVNLAGFALTIDESGASGTTPGSRLTLPIVGSGSLIKTGRGKLRFLHETDSTYSGVTDIREGRIECYNPKSLGSTAGGTIVAPGAALKLKDDMTLAAEPITLAGQLIAEIPTDNLLSFPTVLTGTVTVDGTEALIRDEEGDNPGNGVSLLSINGPLAGTGSLSVNSPVRIAGGVANSFSGPLSVSTIGTVIRLAKPANVTALAGTGLVSIRASAELRVENANQIADGRPVTIGDGSQLTLLAAETIGELNLTGGRVEGPGLLTVVGPVTSLPSGGPSQVQSLVIKAQNFGVREWTIADGDAEEDLIVHGTITNPAGLETGIHKLGAGLLRVGDATLPGITVLDGTVRGTGFTQGVLWKLDGGRIEGTNQSGSLRSTNNGGTFSPGNGGEGIGQWGAQDVLWNPSVTFECRLADATLAAGTGYDQLLSVTSVTLNAGQPGGGAALSLLTDPDYYPVRDMPMVILNKVGAGAISGHFAGLPEGATLLIKGVQHRISYIGGNGNDVTLTALTGTTRVWDGGGADDNWTNAINWQGDEAPRAGDDLVFPAGAAGASVNNFSGNTIFGSVAIEADGYTITSSTPANTLSLVSGLSSTHAGAVSTWNVPIVMTGNMTVTKHAAGGLTLGSAASIITNGHTLIFDTGTAAGLTALPLLANGPLSGNGKVVQRGAGAFSPLAGGGWLFEGGMSFGGNSIAFTGPVEIERTARLAHPSGLGAGAGLSSIVVKPNAALLLHSGPVTRPVLLQNKAGLNISGGVTCSSAVQFSAEGATIQTSGPGVAILSGALTGPPAITNPGILYIIAGAPLRLAGSASNSWGGLTNLTSGTLELAKTGSAVAVPGALQTFFNGSVIRLLAANQITDSASVDLNHDVTFDLGGFNETIGGLTVEGSTVTTGTGVLTVAGNVTSRASLVATSTISGTVAVSGAGRVWDVHDGPMEPDLRVNALVTAVSGGSITKTGAGRITFTGNNTLPAVTVQDGSVFSEGTTATAISQSNGTVGGMGSVANLISTAGMVQPGQHGGAGASPGLLACAQVSLSSASSLQMELLGTARGTQYDAINAGGPVTLGGAQLVLKPAFGSAPAANTVFTLISNASGAAVNGTFAGLAQGAIFAAGGFRWQISYTGGASTRDVTVTNLPATGITRVWDGGAVLNNWNAVENWVGNAAPNPGDDLVFPAGVPADAKATINNYAANTTFNSIRIEDSGYSFAGGSIALNAGIICTYTGGTSTWSVITALTQPQTWSTAGDGLLTVTTGGTSSAVPMKTLTLDAGGAAGGFRFDNTVSGFLNITKTGPGTVTLNGPNTFTGAVSLLGGTVNVQHPTGLGGGSSPVTVNQGTTLALVSSANLTFSRSLILYGRLLSGGATHTINSGPFAISRTCTVEVMPGQTLNITTPFIGQDSLRKTGGGTLVLQQGAFHNDDLLDLHVDAGTVQLSAAAGFRALGGNLFIGGTPGIGAQVVLAAANQISDTATVTLLDANAQFVTNNNAETIAHLDMTGGLVNTGTGTLSLTGSLTTHAAATTALVQGRVTNAGAGQRAWTIADGSAESDLHMTGVIGTTGGATLTKRGAGKLLLSGNSTPGNWVIEDGEVHVSGSVAGFVNLLGGILSGTGNAGDISGSTAGTAAIKPGGDPGLLSVGFFAPHPATTLCFQLHGTARGTTYDSIDALNDTATIAGTLVLEIGGGFIPQRGQTFTLIHGNVNDPPNGSFNGIAEGASFVQGGFRWHINYQANGGIDVVLTCDGIAPTGIPRIWDGGAGGDPRWTTAANWQADTAPSPGDDLVFPAGVSQLVAVNSFPPGTTFNSLSIAAGYTLTEAAAGANDLLLIAGLTVDSPDATSFNIPVTLDAAQTFRFLGSGSHHHIESPVSAGSFAFTLDANTDTEVEINSVISGSGPITKTGPGGLRLTGFNTFTGAATLLGGTTSLTNAGALGTNAGGTTVSGLSTVLRIARPTAMVLAENLTVQNGSLAADFAIHTFSGSITGTGTEAGLSSTFGSRLSLTGVISGVSGWNVTAGDVRFAGTAANTFTGPLTVADGLLTLAKPGGVNALAGPLNIGAGNAGTLVLAAADQIPNATVVTVNGPDAVLDTATFAETLASLTMTGGTVQTAATLTLNGGLTTLPATTPARLAGNITISGGGLHEWTIADGAAEPDLLCDAALTEADIGSVDKLGAGSATFTAVNNIPLRAVEGSIIWNCNSPSSNITLAGGTLSGTGTLLKLLSESAGGTVSPGTSPGALTCSTASLDSSITLRMEADGLTAGTGFDQLIVAGHDLALDDAMLDFRPGFLPAVDDSFAIITGATGISGTFAGLPEDAILSKNGVAFRITYTGGTGHDVVIKRIAVPDPELISHTRTPGTGPDAGNDVVDIEIQGTAGLNYVLEVSEDLFTWTTLLTEPAGERGTVAFHFLEPQTLLRRYHRARLE